MGLAPRVCATDGDIRRRWLAHDQRHLRPGDERETRAVNAAESSSADYCDVHRSARLSGT